MECECLKCHDCRPKGCHTFITKAQRLSGLTIVGEKDKRTYEYKTLPTNVLGVDLCKFAMIVWVNASKCVCVRVREREVDMRKYNKIQQKYYFLLRYASISCCLEITIVFSTIKR